MVFVNSKRFHISIFIGFFKGQVLVQKPIGLLSAIAQNLFYWNCYIRMGTADLNTRSFSIQFFALKLHVYIIIHMDVMIKKPV